MVTASSPLSSGSTLAFQVHRRGAMPGTSFASVATAATFTPGNALCRAEIHSFICVA